MDMLAERSFHYRDSNGKLSFFSTIFLSFNPHARVDMASLETLRIENSLGYCLIMPNIEDFISE